MAPASVASSADVDMPAAETSFADLPPDYWSALRDVPFAELYKITDESYREDMKLSDVRKIINAHKDALVS